mmetsp:Transcript_21509/g.60964  ORF Transcript_21509/g.60964 Transcript_21509/m.60964 type:complete len:204 (-) Transcript_21509:322-933(-)
MGLGSTPSPARMNGGAHEEEAMATSAWSAPLYHDISALPTEAASVSSACGVPKKMACCRSQCASCSRSSATSSTSAATVQSVTSFWRDGADCVLEKLCAMRSVSVGAVETKRPLRTRALRRCAWRLSASSLASIAFCARRRCCIVSSACSQRANWTSEAVSSSERCCRNSARKLANLASASAFSERSSSQRQSNSRRSFRSTS